MEVTVSDYLRRRLISIDKVQADSFFPDRISGECGLCGRECFGLFGEVPEVCIYCFVESPTQVGNEKDRSTNVSNAVKWTERRKAEWEPREGTKQTPLRGSSFSNRVIEIIPGKMAEHRNKAWG